MSSAYKFEVHTENHFVHNMHGIPVECTGSTTTLTIEVLCQGDALKFVTHGGPKAVASQLEKYIESLKGTLEALRELVK